MRDEDGRNRTTTTAHSLVARAFVKGYRSGLQVNHKNGIKTDNRSINLEWCTGAQNVQHTFKVLGRKGLAGRNNGAAKLTARDVKSIRVLLKRGNHFQREIAELFGVTQTAISAIKRGRLWR